MSNTAGPAFLSGSAASPLDSSVGQEVDRLMLLFVGAKKGLFGMALFERACVILALSILA